MSSSPTPATPTTNNAHSPGGNWGTSSRSNLQPLLFGAIHARFAADDSLAPTALALFEEALAEAGE